MNLKKARILFSALIVPAAALMIWQSLLPDEAGWCWQGMGAIVLCVASLAVHFKWVRCPHCGKPVPRAAKTHCTYCGKPYEE